MCVCVCVCERVIFKRVRWLRIFDFMERWTTASSQRHSQRTQYRRRGTRVRSSKSMERREDKERRWGTNIREERERGSERKDDEGAERLSLSCRQSAVRIVDGMLNDPESLNRYWVLFRGLSLFLSLSLSLGRAYFLPFLLPASRQLPTALSMPVIVLAVLYEFACWLRYLAFGRIGSPPASKSNTWRLPPFAKPPLVFDETKVIAGRRIVLL